MHPYPMLLLLSHHPLLVLPLQLLLLTPHPLLVLPLPLLLLLLLDPAHLALRQACALQQRALLRRTHC
jgi:hypothetical protein